MQPAIGPGDAPRQAVVGVVDLEPHVGQHRGFPDAVRVLAGDADELVRPVPGRVLPPQPGHLVRGDGLRVRHGARVAAPLVDEVPGAADTSRVDDGGHQATRWRTMSVPASALVVTAVDVFCAACSCKVPALAPTDTV